MNFSTNRISVKASCIFIGKLQLFILGQEQSFMIIPFLIKVILRHEFIVFNFNFFVDRITFKYDFTALSIVRENVRHVLVDIFGILTSFLYRFQNWLRLKIGYFFFFIFNFFDGFVHIAVVVTEFGVFVALNCTHR